MEIPDVNICGTMRHPRKVTVVVTVLEQGQRVGHQFSTMHAARKFYTKEALRGTDPQITHAELA